MDEPPLEVRMQAVRLLVLDVDGVLTDGAIEYADSPGEPKRFDVRDGFGLRLWRESGRHCAVVTGRKSAAVARRCEELGIAPVVQAARDKSEPFRRVLAECGVAAAQVCTVGDDWPDAPMLLASGVSAAPADARAEIRELVDFVAPSPGGRGAVRDVIERLLRAQNAWDALVAPFKRPATSRP
jgi:3-deoxy-D-manno-octulosonate 8-phosphate phosphatase (KDO 8-P phosphatase)